MPTNYTYDWATQSWVPDTGGASTPAPWQSMPVDFGAGSGRNGATGGYGTNAGMSSGYAAQPYGWQLLGAQANINEYFNNLDAYHQQQRDYLLEQFKAYDDQRESQLKIMMQNGLISNDQYKQMRQLQQQESEFARTLAFKQLEEGHNYEINKAAEMRQERALQAQLAANPSDWVAYEFYKKGLGNPQNASMAANATGPAPGAGQAGTGAGAGGLNPANPTMLGGGAYSPAPPAYADNSLATLANSLFKPNTAYSPGLTGTGAFGSTIASPNSVSRADMYNLSPTERAMMTGLLKAGINIGGQQVSVSPEDYFSQQEKSQVPTLQEGASTKTAYA